MKIVEYAEINPEYAKELLGLNIDNNRNISKHLIRKYVDDMIEDRWLDNGDTIKFDTDGNLIDGQHRLTAIVKSGKTISTTIIWGIDPQAIRTIDTGKSRTLADTLKIDNEKNTSTIATTLSWLWRWNNRSPVPKNLLTPLSTSKAKEILTLNPSIRTSAALIDSYKRKLIGICSPSILCFAHFLFKKKHQGLADLFVLKFCKGNDLTENHPILKAREQMRMMKSNRLKYPDYDYLAVLILAWNQYVHGKLNVKRRLVWDESKGKYPIIEGSVRVL